MNFKTQEGFSTDVEALSQGDAYGGKETDDAHEAGRTGIASCGAIDVKQFTDIGKYSIMHRVVL